MKAPRRCHCQYTTVYSPGDLIVGSEWAAPCGVAGSGPNDHAAILPLAPYDIGFISQTAHQLTPGNDLTSVYIHRHNAMSLLVVALVGRWTRDRKVAGSTPGRRAIKSTRSTQPSIPPG